jgi:hypothetical protein
MSIRRLPDADARASTAASDGHVRVPLGRAHGLAQRRAGPHSPKEAEEVYIASRDAWKEAMRRAASGRPADLASLAIAQEAYEAALMERERWASGRRVAISIEPDTDRRGIDAVVGQELAWRKVHKNGGQPRGLMHRLRRLIGR